MKLQRDQAFVLRTTALGDADLIVSLLTAEHGKVRGVARSARRSRRRFGGILEPLTRVEASWSEKEGRELHRIEALDGVHSYAPMQSDPLKQAACAVLSEISDVLAHEGQPDQEPFRLLVAVLDCLERGDAPFPLLRYFEFWTLRLHGMLPDFDQCARCDRPMAGQAGWIGVSGGIHCRDCRRVQGVAGGRLSTGDRAFLEAIQGIPPSGLPRSDAVNRAARGQGSVATLLRRGLESFAEKRLRTYRHLEAIAGPPGESQA